LLPALVAACSGAPTIPLITKPAPKQLTALDASKSLTGTVYFAQGGRIWRLRRGQLNVVTSANYAYPAITADGTSTAAAYVAKGQSIIAFGGPDFSALQLAKPLVRDAWKSGSLDLKPAFSPNGKRVAFMSDRKTSDEAIWEGPVSGGVHQVSFPPDASGGDDAPAYLADGTGIVFTVWRNGHGALDQAAVPLGRPRVLLTATDRDYLDPAPGPGGQLAFTQRQGEVENIYLGAADGGGAHALTTVNDARQPAWSPDGKDLLFISPHAGTFDLWVVPAAGGPARQLTTGGDLDANSRPAWSPS
jgi:Tol biopolymer transport system component